MAPLSLASDCVKHGDDTLCGRSILGFHSDEALTALTQSDRDPMFAQNGPQRLGNYTQSSLCIWPVDLTERIPAKGSSVEPSRTKASVYFSD